MKRFIPILLVMPIMLSSCAKEPTLAEKIVFGCDTIFEIKAYNKETEDLNEIEDMILKYSKLFDGFNSYNNINNIYTINNTNDSVKIDKDLFDALKIADSYKSKTNGYFNPYLGELTFAYKEAYQNNSLPSENFINSALLEVNSFKLEFNETDFSVKRIGNSKIDLGAFAKGYVIDKVKELALTKDINNYMINGGSSSNYFTSKINDDPYKVGIRYLPKKYLKLKNTSLGISSIYEQLYEINGEKYSHIINPFSGKPSMDYEFSAVIHPSATLTDVFSTVLMCVPNVDTIKSFEKDFEFSCLIYKDNKEFYKSPNLILESY